MSRSIRRLPNAELEVMQALWACESPAARTDIEARLTRPMAPTTLLTLLTRLGEKDFLTVEKEGRKCLYTPAVAESDYVAAQGSDFFHTLCGGSVPAFAAALCDSGLSREDLAELRRLLEEGSL